MQSIRGMHDILPAEIKYWQYIYSTANRVLGLSNYNEIRTPILEETSLFSKSIGDTTDIINKEMYTFSDQSERSITLRPEGTASIARAILQHKLHKIQPIQKLWYMGPMFRYERPQQGRQRQFHQLGIECYGSDNAILDAEIIYLATQILNQLKCINYIIEINSIGNLEDRTKYCDLLKTYLKTYYNDLDNESKRLFNKDPLRILDSKNQQVQDILQESPSLHNSLNNESIRHFEEVQEYLHSLDIQYKVNKTLVRGLDYYNDTVFEIKNSTLGAQNTICGGGRYNTLTTQLGGEAIPAAGWGIGIERLLLLIKEQLCIKQDRLYIYLVMQTYEAIKYGLQLIPEFHKNCLTYEIDLSNSSLQKQIKKANKKEAKICIVIGEDEVINNYITVKWLDKYEQQTYSFDDLKKVLTSL